MRAVVFLLYLCSFLLRGDVAAWAGMGRSGVSDALVQPAEKNGELKFAAPGHKGNFINQTSPDRPEYLICDFSENEDEDLNAFWSDDCALPGGYTLGGSYRSILIYLYNSFKAPPPFYGPASCLYLVQRTLRI